MQGVRVRIGLDMKAAVVCSSGCLVFLAFAPVSVALEINSLLGARDLLIATDHSSPDQIGPVIHHHLHEERVAPQGLLEFEVAAGVDSRYVSEGRDNLAGEGGIGWLSAVGHVHTLGGAVFTEVFGIAAWEANYEEAGVTAGYEFERDSFSVGGAVTYLWFPEDEEEDVELALFGEWTCGCGFGIASEIVWSTEAEGWFGETALFYELSVTERFQLIPVIFVGINQGYVSDEHDGLNHLGVQLEGVVSLSDNLEFSAYAAAVEPLDEESGETLDDLFWVGGALSVSF